MPSTLPRVQVRLTHEQYAAIAAIAARSRLSMSRIVSDIIEPHLPVLRSAAKMLEDAAHLTEKARADLAPMLAANERRVVRAHADAFATLAETQDAISKARGRGVSGAKRAPPQPSASRRRRPPAE